jgi:co-chaperonin GroES (HSP10)
MKVGHDKVLVCREKAPETTASGILKIPEAAREKPDFGEVVAVGSDVFDWAIGDRVIFPKWSGFQTSLPDDDRDLLILFATEVWAAV